MSGSEPFDPYYKWLGIPPKDQPPNYYRLLGLETFERNPDVINAATRRVASFVQSYGTGAYAPLAERLIGEIALARRCLLDPPSKRLYDANLPPPRATSAGAETDEFSFLETIACSPPTAIESDAPPASSAGALSPLPAALARTAQFAEKSGDHRPPLSRKERAQRTNLLVLIGAGIMLLFAVGIFVILQLVGKPSTLAETPSPANAKIADEKPGNATVIGGQPVSDKKPAVKPLLPPASTPAEKAQLVDAVFQAIDDGADLETFKQKLEAAHRPDLRNEQQRSPLRMAVIRNREDLVQELIARKFDVNASDVHGETALMSAAQVGNPRLAKILLDAGGRANASSGQSEKDTDPLLTPLLIAAHSGNGEIVNLLLAHGAKVELPNADGVTPLMVAAWKGYPEVVRQLLAAKANVNAADNIGQTPLMFAAAGGKLEIVEALLARGAKAKAIGKYGNTALDIAEAKDDPKIAARIRAANGR